MDTKKLRQKILDLAIHGKLVPQDPTDEPASVLLERIKAEKERLIKEGKIKRSKKSAKTSDTPHYENVPFEVPEGWVWCRLGDVISIKSGDSIRVRDNRQGEYPIYGGNGINGYYSDCNVKPDTIVIGRVGFYCGSIHQTVSKAWVTDNAFIVSYESVFNSEYLCHLLEWLQLSKTSNSTAQPVISGKGIYPLLIPLPPLSEQERIVSEVKRCFTLIDIIENGKSDLQTTIKQTKSKILDLAIHGKLVPQDPNDEPAIELLKRINPDFIPCDNGHYPQLPDSWSTTTLKDLCESINGLWKGKKEPFIHVGIIRNANFTKDFKLDYSNIEYIDVEQQTFAKRHLMNGDLIVEKSGGSDNNPVGRTILYEGKSGVFSFSNFTMVLRIKHSNTILSKFLYYYILAIYQKGAMRLMQTQTTGLHNLILDKFLSMPIHIPSLSEQEQIVERIETIFTSLDMIMESL